MLASDVPAVTWVSLRYMQTLADMSSSYSSTIVFPLPIEMMSSFMGKAQPGKVSSKNDEGSDKAE